MRISAIFLMVLSLTAVLILCLAGCKDTIVEPPPNESPVPTDDSPAWSPDGNWIAYTHSSITVNDSNYPTGLYIIDTNGNNRRLILLGNISNPDWSPDGRRIVFNSGDIFTITPTGDSLTQLTNIGGAFFPSYSPDGRLILYDATSLGVSNGLWIFNLKTKQNDHIGLGRDADWAPNGVQFVYEGSPGTTKSEDQIWISDTSGATKSQLTSNASVINRYPSWSPDGSTIAWTTDRSICLMNSDGSNQRELLDDYSSHPSWSPDSRTIVFEKLDSQKSKINLWTINVDGSHLKQITF